MKKGIVGAMSLLAGAAGGVLGVGKIARTKINIERQYANKHLELYKMMAQWVKIKQQGKSLASYFEENGFKKIAIYGMSYAGQTLVEELRNSGIEVVYGIDQNASLIYEDVDIVTMDDELEEVDVVVVTAITFFDEIEEKLSMKINSLIISLEEVLEEI